MATVGVTPTATLSLERTVTVTASVTVYATVTAMPSPAWADVFEAACCYQSIILVLTNILVIYLLNDFNRLVAVPLVSSVSGAIAFALNWYGWWDDTLTDGSRRSMVLVGEVFWIFNNLSLPFYSFFLLEKVLVDRQRRIFLSVFVVLWVALLGTKAATAGVGDQWWTRPDDYLATSNLVDKISRSYYAQLALLESWSAFFLLRTFYQAKRQNSGLGGGNRGLFASLMRSSEVRVASLVFIAFARLACYRAEGNGSPIVKDIDRFAATLNSCFPFILQLDVVATRLIKSQAAAAAAAGRGNIVAAVQDSDQNNNNNNSGSIPEKVPVVAIGSPEVAAAKGRFATDSLRSEYNRYGMGFGWSQGSSAWSRKGSAATMGLSRKGSTQPVTQIMEVSESTTVTDSVICRDLEEGARIEDK